MIAGSVVAAIAVSGGMYLELRNKNKIPAYTVARVIDGDTFETTEKQLIRLMHVEAPELKYCGGQEAKEALEKLVLGKPVYVKVLFRDQYSRLESLVYLEDGFVNKKMVESGWVVYRIKGKTSPESEELKRASSLIRENKLGIFSEACTPTKNTKKPRCNIKGNNREESDAKYYHLPTCGRYQATEMQLYKGDQWFCTESEAQAAGYVKADQCPD